MSSGIIKTLQSLQVARGLAATLVILTHSIAGAKEMGYSYIGSFYNLADFGSIGVDIFFVISGVIMTIITTKNQQSPKHFLIKRCIKILPLYWGLSLFCYVISFVGFWPRINTYEILETITIIPFFDSGFAAGPIIYLGWTLAFEFLFYIIYAFALWINKQKAFLIVMCLLPALVALGYIFPNITDTRFRFASNPIILEFLMGCICGYIYLGKIKISATPAFIVLGTGIFILFFNIIKGYGNISEMGYTWDGSLSLIRVFKWGICSFFLVAGLVLLEKNGKLKAPRVLITTGDISYSAYLVHIFCVRFLIAIWHKLSLANPDLFILIAILFSLAAAYITYRFIEKPVTVYLNKKFDTNYKSSNLTTQERS